ncbi:MAG: YdeI/OmpD-associated family protein [Ilumatobacteraceae bacterium]
MAVAAKPELYLHTVAEWQQWLEGSPSPDGVRLRLRKVSSTQPGFTYAEALDVALCFGWIDGQSISLDADFFLRVFTPRRRNSPWSKINRGHVERLTAEGRMQPGGHAEIERAKADGRWDAAYRMADNDVPADLQAALDANPVAAAAFAGLSKQNRFAIVFRLGSVKRAETRQRKLGEYLAMLERGETIHPQ